MRPDLTDDEIDGICGYAWLDANWKSLVIGPDAPTYTYRMGRGPTAAGVYLLWSATDALLYVGRSNNVARRWLAHHKVGVIPFDAVSWVCVNARLCNAVEAAYIEALEPPYNRQVEPSEWGGHDRMRLRVDHVWRKALRASACQI